MTHEMPSQSPDDNRPETDMFCISCGGPDPVADGQCRACLLEELTVAKGPRNRVAVEICRHCGATPVQGNWQEPPSRRELVEQTAIGSVAVPEDLEDLVIGIVLEQQDRDAYRVTVQVEGSYKDVPVQGEVPVEVRVRGASCPACSRRHGGYFEAVVQVRREGEADVTDEEAGDIAVIIEEEVRSAGGLSGGQGYLLKAEHMHGGYDYYFGTKPVARAVAKRLMDRYGAQVNESFTLIGERDGKEVRRLTLAVRIPQATPGSIVAYNDEVLRVRGRKGNRLLTYTVEEGAKRMLEDRDLDRIEVLEPRVLDVVYAEGGEGQVLDPDSYKTVEVRLPHGVHMGDQVSAVEHRGEWIVLGRA